MNIADHLALFISSIVLAVLVFVAVLLVFIFGAVRRVGERQRAALESEGIEMESGRVPVTIHFNGFRAQGISVGVGLHKGPLIAVLTKKRLVFVPSRRPFLRIDRADLGRFTVSSEDGVLRMHSDDPPKASGTIDFRISVSDPAAWVSALVTAGAKANSHAA